MKEFATMEWQRAASALEAARKLANTHPDSAASRAYYAAFRVTRNSGRDRGEFTPTETGQDHGLVMNHFKSSSDRTRRKIGVDLDRLYDYRTSADYDDVLAGRPISLAQSSVAVARNVLNTLNSL